MIPIRDMLPSRRFPAVTIALIAINLLVFLYQGYIGTRPPVVADWGYVETAWEEKGLDPPPSFIPRRLDLPPPFTGTTTRFPVAQDELFISRYALIPAEFLGGEDLPPTIPIPIWLTILTSLFLHGGVMHLFGNMLYLWIFGDNVEDAMGPLRFLTFYLVCGAAASFTQIAIAPGSTVPVIGASGAIAGILAAYFMLFPRARVLTLIPILFFIRLVSIPAVFFLGFWFLLQVISGAGALGTEGGVAWFAHIGGFLAGAILVIPFRRKNVPIGILHMYRPKRHF